MLEAQVSAWEWTALLSWKAVSSGEMESCGCVPGIGWEADALESPGSCLLLTLHSVPCLRLPPPLHGWGSWEGGRKGGCVWGTGGRGGEEGACV